MSVAYRIDSRGVIRTKCSGNVTLDEVCNHLRTLDKDPCRPERADVLLDLSETDSLPEGNQVRAVGDVLRLETRMQFGACAIVTCSDVLFGMMRMFEAVAHEQFRATHVFRTISEAEVWLMEQSRFSRSQLKPQYPRGGISG
jgi:hypothetical protein